LFQYAKGLGLRTTAHLYETPDGCHPELLPFLDRIGHGIQIPLRYPKLLPQLARRKVCLEVCPTTYLRTGTLTDYHQLRPVFARCREAGVPIALCTDNGGLHGVRLPHEYENLLIRDVISFEQMTECHAASFAHAFAWRGTPRMR
jgi:adenosine deaminase